MATDQTYGQRAVGLTFNPSGHPEVEAIKIEFAKLIDRMDAWRNAAGRSMKTRARRSSAA